MAAEQSSLRAPALEEAELEGIIAYWEVANYLTVAQIYLLRNPLLREALRPEHIKPRLLGHWGTSPGLTLIYAQLNRMIRAHGDEVLYVAGPGHGGPAIVANVYLEGTYSEVYPEVSRDEAGLLNLMRQFSTPAGIPSHVSVPTPGSIHEGGELGYALVHAFGAAFDTPDLIVACVIGDGEAETAPLEGSWKGIRYLNPVRDGPNRRHRDRGRSSARHPLRARDTARIDRVDRTGRTHGRINLPRPRLYALEIAIRLRNGLDHCQTQEHLGPFALATPHRTRRRAR